MSTPSTSLWYRADITLRAKASPSTTLTVTVTNRPQITNLTVNEYPIIRQISGVGNKVGRLMPEASSATLVLDNSPGNFGVERRFLDLFERYTPIDQDCVVYYAITAHDTLTVSSWTQLWKSRVKAWRSVGATISMQLQADALPRRVVTKQINSWDFPDAPQESIGKSLPLVFGEDIEVRAVCIQESNSAPVYGYATTLADDYISGGVQSIYVKNLSGEFASVLSSSAVGTVVFGMADQASSLLATILLVTQNEKAYKLELDGATNYVITQAVLHSAALNTTAPVDGKFILKIYSTNALTGLPDKVLARSERDKTDFSAAIAGATTADIEFPLPEALALTDVSGYWVSIQETPGTTGSFNLRYNVYSDTGYSGTFTSEAYLANATESGVIDTWVLPGRLAKPDIDFYAVKFTDVPTPTGTDIDSNGLGTAKIELTQRAAIGSLPNPDLMKLDTILSVDGLKDDGSGTITGVAGSVIKHAHDAIALLDLEWSGSAWTGGRFDWTKFSATHAAAFDSAASQIYRRLDGSTEGKRYVDELISEICDNSACRVVMHNGASKQVALYAWGSQQVEVAEIGDDEASNISIEQMGLDTVVNNLDLFYGFKLRDIDFTTGTAEGEFTSYSGHVAARTGLASRWTTLAADSVTLYGLRTRVIEKFDLIGHAATAENIAAFILGTSAHPLWYVSFDVPFAEYATLDLMDVVALTSPEMPDYFGTSANATLPYYEDAVQINGGYDWKRARRYRLQIEGKEVNLDDSAAPKLRLYCRILTSPGDPT